jgi:PhzF family phenazine biosynthesis protein
MTLPIFQVDAFTHELFGGNPAAVCPLPHWLPKTMMQQIAAENNLAETAFYVPLRDDFDLKWFTPQTEVDLCGHATLASAYVIFNIFNYAKSEIRFHSNSGVLAVKRNSDGFTLNFPADDLKEADEPQNLSKALGAKPLKIFKGKTDYLVIVSSEEEVQNLHPDFYFLQKVDARGMIVSARGNNCDYVLRFFGPNVGINEDPATGSSHTTLAPFWAKELNKKEFTARQLSQRKGFFECKLKGDRVEISGSARLYLKGEIYIEE